MKPILFNTEMARAILGGRKTVTRRVIKDKDIVNALDCESDGTPIVFIDHETGDSHPPAFPCQYQPGDILYVRETWYKDPTRYMYKANYSDTEKFFRDGKEVQIKWRPSIHMPKEAARIFLRVADIRVERLQEMPHDAPKKEGIHYCEYPDGFTWNSHTTMRDCYINQMGAMKALWNSTVKKSDLETYGWDANPWVWVIEFERISREEAEKEEHHVD